MSIHQTAFPVKYFLIAAAIIGCGRESDKPLTKQQPGLEKTESIESPVPSFNGEKALEQLKQIVSFGPRNPNSPGHEKCIGFLVTKLRSLADDVRTQDFVHKGYEKETLRLGNVIAAFNPENKDRLLLCTHWDTRPRAERDSDPERWNTPIPGANDGASGVAVLLEIASLLKSSKPRIGVDLVFFDGEDYGYEGDVANYLLGSRHFARAKEPDYLPRFGILLDMVGDAQLDILKEEYSLRFAPDVVDLVWKKAAELGFTQFIDAQGEAITDDHLPLNEAGIRTIDLIDFAYPDESHRYWHTHDDTPDKCSAESLEAVGTVLTHIVYTQLP